MNLLGKYIALAAATLIAASAHAQVEVTVEENADSVYNIIDAINDGGTVYVVQPQELDKLVMRSGSGSQVDNAAGSATANGRAGYRIQIFSDNNMRSAKANAEQRKRAVEQRTGMRAYLSYEAPYWRVRVGDFHTQADADAALRELKALFPNYATDMRIVRERVNAHNP